MAEQVLVQIRVDKNERKKITEILGRIGLDIPTAIRIYLKKIEEANDLPFSIGKDYGREEASRILNEIRKESQVYKSKDAIEKVQTMPMSQNSDSATIKSKKLIKS